MTVIALVSIDSTEQRQGKLAALVDAEVRGVTDADQTAVPFGPHKGHVLFHLMIYARKDREQIALQFANGSGSVIPLLRSGGSPPLAFRAESALGSAVTPEILNGYEGASYYHTAITALRAGSTHAAIAVLGPPLASLALSSGGKNERRARAVAPARLKPMPLNPCQRETLLATARGARILRLLPACERRKQAQHTCCPSRTAAFVSGSSRCVPPPDSVCWAPSQLARTDIPHPLQDRARLLSRKATIPGGFDTCCLQTSRPCQFCVCCVSYDVSKCRVSVSQSSRLVPVSVW